MPRMEGKYSVELFLPAGERAGVEEILDRHDNLTIARAICRGRVEQFPGRLVMLRDRARLLPAPYGPIKQIASGHGCGATHCEENALYPTKPKPNTARIINFVMGSPFCESDVPAPKN
jgi:hypothetical protein